MMVGMVLGAYLGDDGIPKEWSSGLKRGSDISSLLKQMER
jgi:ADP-ribosylglycohydrolase